MHACSNCSESFDPKINGVLVTERNRVVAAVCERCCEGVRVGKIVIRKPDVGGYVYEQWLPTEIIDVAPRASRAG